MAKKWANGQSHMWKRMMEIKNIVEPCILWKICTRMVAFCWDNLTKLESLANICPVVRASKNIKVHEFIQGGA